MRVCIHRGTKQIGGSCIELAHEGVRILLDVGLPLDSEFGDTALLPHATQGIAAVIVSHPHVDHYGLLHHLPAGTPVGIGAAARRIIQAAAPFTGQPLPPLDGFDLQHGTPLQIGPFRITPYLVDHSAYDAYGLLVEASGKRLFYSGDFRGHGRKGRLFDAFLQHPPSNIDVLLMEGTTLSRLEEDDAFPSEAALEKQVLEQIRATSGLVMVYASAQNIDRVVTLYRACKQAGRTLVIDISIRRPSSKQRAMTVFPSLSGRAWHSIPRSGSAGKSSGCKPLICSNAMRDSGCIGKACSSWLRMRSCCFAHYTWRIWWPQTCWTARVSSTLSGRVTWPTRPAKNGCIGCKRLALKCTRSIRPDTPAPATCNGLRAP